LGEEEEYVRISMYDIMDEVGICNVGEGIVDEGGNDIVSEGVLGSECGVIYVLSLNRVVFLANKILKDHIVLYKNIGRGRHKESEQNKKSS
jgi:hypothetical protein